MIIDPRQAREDLPTRDAPLSSDEAVEIMKQKGFHFSSIIAFHWSGRTVWYYNKEFVGRTFADLILKDLPPGNYELSIKRLDIESEVKHE